MVALVFACTLTLPATSTDIAVYQHCQENVDSWNLALPWANLVSDHFDYDDVSVALKIIGCESNGKATAKNPTSTATGLWQFISKTWSWVEYKLNVSGNPRDPHLSTHFAAFLKYKTSQGWGHWSESAHCWEEPNEKNKFTKIN